VSRFGNLTDERFDLNQLGSQFKCEVMPTISQIPFSGRIVDSAWSTLGFDSKQASLWLPQISEC
jgi:hypothetical protein